MLASSWPMSFENLFRTLPERRQDRINLQITDLLELFLKGRILFQLSDVKRHLSNQLG